MQAVLNSVLIEGQVTLMEDRLTRKLTLKLEQVQELSNCVTEEVVQLKKEFLVKIRDGRTEDNLKSYLNDGDRVRVVGKLDIYKDDVFILADHVEVVPRLSEKG